MGDNVIKLQLKKDRDPSDRTSHIFYRYEVGNGLGDWATVWFSQSPDNGNIYSAYVNLPDPLNHRFELYVDVPADGPYYPKDITAHIKPRSIDYTALNRYADFVNRLNLIAVNIRKLFSDCEARNLYLELNDNQIFGLGVT